MEFPSQEYWSGLPFPSPGDLPNLGIEPSSPASQEDSLPRATGKAPLGLLVTFYPLRQTLCTFQGAVGR